MPLNLIKFFNLSYLFDLRPSIYASTVYFLLAVFGALIVLSLLIKIIEQKFKPQQFLKKLFQKYFSLFLTMGLVGLALLWFRYENAAVLSARFWLLVWALAFVIWLVNIFQYQLKIVPPAREKSEQKKIFQKYLPKKK